MVATRTFVAILAILGGLAGVFFGVVAFGLRCFDTCPTTSSAELKADIPIATFALLAVLSFVGALVYDKPRIAWPVLAAAAAIVLVLGLYNTIAGKSTTPILTSLLVALLPGIAAVLAFVDARERKPRAPGG